MSELQGSDFTVAELKMGLRWRGLSTGGSKAALIQRLDDGDSGVWTALSRQLGSSLSASASGSGDSRDADVAEVEEERIAEAGEQGAASPVWSEGRRRIAAARGEREYIPSMEEFERAKLILLREERDLWERDYFFLRERLFFLRERTV